MDFGRHTTRDHIQEMKVIVISDHQCQQWGLDLGLDHRTTIDMQDHLRFYWRIPADSHLALELILKYDLPVRDYDE